MVYPNDIRQFIESTPWALDGVVQRNLLPALENEVLRLKNVSQKLKFSFLCPLYNTDPRHLRELIWSCQAQTWSNWELILIDDGSPKSGHIAVAQEFADKDQRIHFIRAAKNGGISAGRNRGVGSATGDFVGILDHDDLIHPQALSVFAREILDADQRPTFVFSNECKISDDSSELSDFFYKPAFCKSTLLRSNYIAHLTFIERSLFLECAYSDQVWYRTEYDGVEDHEFFLRVSDHKKFQALHIPLFAYLWRKAATSTSASMAAKPYVYERGVKMIAEYVSAKSLTCTKIVQPLDAPSNRFFQVHLKNSLTARVLTVVPFKGNTDLTLSCLSHLDQQTLKSEVLLIDNDSSPQVRDAVERWITDKKRKCKFRIESFSGAFDYAKMHNSHLEHLQGQFEFFFFLNNDVDLIEPTSLERMLAEYGLNPKLAFVGMRLMYPGNVEVQHGGIQFGPETSGSGHLRPAHMTSMRQFVFDEHIVPAVTFASCVCPSSVWYELNGLESLWLPNGLGDVDICLRASQNGYSNVYLGSVVGIHHESKTRSKVAEDLELSKLHQRNASEILRFRLERLEYDSFQFGQAHLGMPMRYRVADKVNDAVKSLARPVHGLLKSQLVKWGAR